MRTALRGLAAPVGVLLAHDGLEVRGATVTAFMPVALDPPSIAIGVGRPRRVRAALSDGSPCTLNVLAAGQENIADYFANSMTRAAGVSPVRLGRDERDCPVVPNALFTLGGVVAYSVGVGDHSIVIVTIEDVQQSGESDAEPLLWHEGSYGYMDR